MSETQRRPLRAEIVLAAFNGHRFVDDQLRSVVEQTRAPDLILVRDDGSTDGTADAIREILSTSGVPFDLATNDNRRGAVGNFAGALAALSDGPPDDVVFLCDQDDVWSRSKVEVVMGLFDEAPSLLAAFSNGRLIDGHGRPLPGRLWERTEFTGGIRRRWDRGDQFGAVVARNPAPGATMAFRRGLLATALPIPTVGWHDHWLLRVATLCGPVAAVDVELVDYRLHEANAVGLPPARGRATPFVKARRLTSPDPAVQLVAADLAQLQSLEARVVDRPEQLARVVAARRHVAARASLPLARPRRVPIVVRELARGGYARYSNGWRAALRDVLGDRSTST